MATNPHLSSRLPHHLPRKTDYHDDFSRWLQENIDFLRAKQFSAADWQNLLEELEAVGKRDRLGFSATDFAKS